MPLDCSIFKDLDDVVNRHIALTSLLKKGADGYELRFSRRDPKAIVFAYERIWTANPLGKRICQDVNRCFGKHLLAIRAVGTACKASAVGTATAGSTASGWAADEEEEDGCDAVGARRRQ